MSLIYLKSVGLRFYPFSDIHETRVIEKKISLLRNSLDSNY